MKNLKELENLQEYRKEMNKQRVIEELTDIESREYQCFHLGIEYSEFWKYHLNWNKFDKEIECESCGNKLETFDERTRGWCDICNDPGKVGSVRIE